jgi:hypothetical protein
MYLQKISKKQVKLLEDRKAASPMGSDISQQISDPCEKREELETDFASM